MRAPSAWEERLASHSLRCAGGAARRRGDIRHRCRAGAQGTKHARTHMRRTPACEAILPAPARHAGRRAPALLAMPYVKRSLRSLVAWSKRACARVRGDCRCRHGVMGGPRAPRGDRKSGTGRGGVPCALPRARAFESGSPRPGTGGAVRRRVRRLCAVRWLVGGRSRSVCAASSWSWMYPCARPRAGRHAASVRLLAHTCTAARVMDYWSQPALDLDRCRSRCVCVRSEWD